MKRSYSVDIDHSEDGEFEEDLKESSDEGSPDHLQRAETSAFTRRD